jgi:hypothetical protein
MPQLFTGTLAIAGAESFLDNHLLLIDDLDCADLACRAGRARDFFVNQSVPSGSTVTVCGFKVAHEDDGNGGRDNVIHMFRDNSQCQ